ncbi:hypothetical protein ACFL5V_06305 [Fibrobacterota bacterium]
MKKKDIPDKIGKLKKMVNQPKYICCKCGRAANKKGYVCKPSSIEAGT